MIKTGLKFLILFLFWPTFAGAATLFFAPDKVQISPSQLFEVEVFLDPQGQNLNALSGQLEFDSDKLVLQKIKNKQATVGFWLEEPQLKKAGVINFAGVIPGGFSGVLGPTVPGAQPGKLFSLVFSVQESGDYTLSWSNLNAFLNQADNQEIKLIATSLLIHSALGLANSAPVSEKKTDQQAPELFTPVIDRDPHLFGQRWFLVFAARDPESGVARYEMVEHKKASPPKSGWREVNSPAVLVNQSLTSFISVRAIDEAGNERLVTLAPARVPPWYQHFLILGIILVLTAGGLIAVILWPKPVY